MPYLHVYDQLDSDCQATKAEAVGILYERYFETFRRHAFRCLKTRKYAHDAIEQATELAMDVFERILRWVSKDGWPGGRTTAPWKDDSEFEAYWFTAIDRRSIDACKLASRSRVADPNTSAIFDQSPVLEAEKDEVDYSEVIKKIHQAARESLKDRHFRVIPAFALEYMEFKDTKTLTELYAVVAEKKQLGSGPYVANCWSAGVCLVKRAVCDMSSKAAADLLAKAALTNGFPVPRRA